MKGNNRLAAVMCVNIFSMHCATSSANEEDVSLHALLNVDRLGNIMARQPEEPGAPGIRLSNGTILTPGGMLKALQPLIQSRPENLQPLIEALSDPRQEVRFGANLALMELTGRHMRFDVRSTVGSEAHLEKVRQWRKAIDEENLWKKTILEEKKADPRVLLSAERLENIMDRQPAAHSGPSVRLPSGRILTANGLREALASLVDALSDRREEVRWGACLALEEITDEKVRFHRTSKVGSSIHLEGVNKWIKVIEQWKK